MSTPKKLIKILENLPENCELTGVLKIEQERDDEYRSAEIACAAVGTSVERFSGGGDESKIPDFWEENELKVKKFFGEVTA